MREIDTGALLPCPFCGSDGDLAYQGDCPTQCSVCFACGPDPESAGHPCSPSLSWNSRAEAEALRAEVAKLWETNQALHRRTQKAESAAYIKAGRWKRKLERVKAFADHMLTANIRANKKHRETQAEIAALREQVKAADAVMDELERHAFEIDADDDHILDPIAAYRATRSQDGGTA